jgi:hypothetical protein
MVDGLLHQQLTSRQASCLAFKVTEFFDSFRQQRFDSTVEKKHFEK